MIPASTPWPARAALVAVAGVWVAVAFVLLTPGVTYYGDFGIKFVQALSLINSHFQSLSLYYPGGSLDPRGLLVPFEPPFVMVLPGGVQGIYPPLTAMFVAGGVLIGGAAGVVGLVLLAGLAAVRLSAVLVDGAAAWLLTVGLGLGTCFWFYATLPWEHTVAVAFDVAAFALALRQPAVRGISIGILLGMGTGFRAESMLLLPGVLIACWMRGRNWRPLVGACAAFAAVIAATAAIDVWAYGRPPQAHAAQVVGALRTALGVGASIDQVTPTDPLTLSQRYQTVVHYWLFGGVSSAWVWALVAAIVAASVLYRRRQTAVGVFVVAVCVFGWSAVRLAAAVAQPGRWIDGLFTESPFLLFALLPMPWADAGTRRDRAALQAASLAYAVLAFVTSDIAGGKAFGPRFLLPIVPLLCAAAAQGISAYATGANGTTLERWTGRVGQALVVTSIGLALAVTLPNYVRQNEAASSVLEAILASPERIVIASDQSTAQLLAPIYQKKILLLGASGDQSRFAGLSIGNAGLPSFLLVRRGPRPELEFAPFHEASNQTIERLRIERWVR